MVAAGKNDDNTLADVVFYKRHLGLNKFSNIAVLARDVNKVESVIAVDVDGDNWVDIVIARRGDNEESGSGHGLYWLENQCEGDGNTKCDLSRNTMFGEAQNIETDIKWYDISAVVAGDFNQDGKQDLVVAAWNTKQSGIFKE